MGKNPFSNRCQTGKLAYGKRHRGRLVGSVMKEWIVCEDNCLKCSYGATLDCDGDCPRCPRNTYCPCVTFVSFAAGKLAPVAQPVTTTFERPRKR
jgi:hypothetical protein